ncbi:uncharacterized protein LOC113507863, partial [Trichoplusia ni]|uniref:Uncharacterized protein LOC113507863 n=1 Tax=Trichoplusia ni TaxID=7111 RepID=A0A7E5X1N4_TRINI
MLLMRHNCIKVNFELFAYFLLPTLGEQQLKSFNTKYEIIYNNTDFDDTYLNVIETFKRKFTEFEHCQSGWSFVSINHLEININKYCPMRGGTYLELPDVIKNTKSCLNIHNNDEYCFLWCVVAALFPAKNNVCRVNSYPHFSTVLNTRGISFPPSHKDIKLFEKNNCDLSINIYGFDKHGTITGPIYVTNCRKDKHINLLFFEKHNKGHYCLIKNLLRLVRRQVSCHKGRMYLCETCLQFFKSEIKYNCHSCSQILTVLPDKNSTLKFKNYERKQKINFVIYADFESILLNCKMEQNDKNTVKNKVHQPSCFAFYVCCSHDSSLNKFVSYRGSDCVEVFIKSLIEEVKLIHKMLLTEKPMRPMTRDQTDNYNNATTCHICNDLLFDDKVCDHDHITSEYRGAAHSQCNLNYRVCPFIPVIFHNLVGYDSHIFITELSKYEGEIRIIAETKEKYLTITKIINTGKGCKPAQIKFIDSFKFLSSSLDNL